VLANHDVPPVKKRSVGSLAHQFAHQGCSGDIALTVFTHSPQKLLWRLKSDDRSTQAFLQGRQSLIAAKRL
jgi:hypothetical protein